MPSFPADNMPLYYTAVHRFAPECAGDRWRDYVAWSGLEQLQEVISLDQLLCPNFFESPSDEDWDYNVQEANKLHLFHDLDYVLRKTALHGCVQVVGVIHSPTPGDLASAVDPRLRFCGYDLLETGGGISALVNCGGFERSFTGRELNAWGLFDSYQRTREVKASLVYEYPEEPHARCDVWALYRCVRDAKS